MPTGDDNKSAPKYVFQRLKEYLKDKELSQGDQIWIMVDVDRWNIEQLAEICSEALKGKKKANLAVSNPCFEIWLLLHITENRTTISCKECENKLRDHLGSYNKANINIDDFKKGIDEAILRAEKMDNNPNIRWPENPGTFVYKVVKEIKKII